MSVAPFDLVIRRGRAVLPTGLRACDIAVRGGKIAAVLTPGESVTAAAELDAAGLVVMPGIIDVHLHLGHGADISRPRAPGDAATETAAAAKGGITCFIPYLMSGDPFEDVFPDVRDVTEAGARIDVGYHFCISTEAQLASVERYAADYGVSSFKIFMNNRGGEGKRLGLPDIDDGFLFRLCEAAARAGGIVCPHPETIELAWVFRERVMRADPDGKAGLSAWNDTRPPFVEADAVQRAALIADAAGAPLYVVHTSSRAALDAALRQRRAGMRVHVETCPHYLTHDITWSGGVVGKINPPLRELADRDALWQAVLDGDVDTVATDHVHRDLSAKQGNIWAASPGCPGLETLLPVMLTEGHHRRGLSLERIAALLAGNPARIMGLGGVKGAIQPGLDADFALVDLDAEWTLERSDVASSAGYSIYEGWRMRGRVVHTICRGRTVLENGALREDAVGTGRYVRRSLAVPQHTATEPRAAA
ncbi:MAG: dihydroorotase family protein [Acetobacteraceae bacterium]|nr:dihydroorotase family protein [Acetobacteraceae bacterium]